MKKVRFSLYLLISWFLLHEMVIALQGTCTQPAKSEYAVIFGNTVYPDGTLSKRLEARLREGLKLYQEEWVDTLFVSGGIGIEGQDEAHKMAEFLIRQGVPSEVILIDSKGNNSWLTAINFQKQAPHAKSIVLVTQFYHYSRCKLAFKKLGDYQLSGATPDYYETRDVYSLLREFFGYYYYLLMK